MDIPSSRSSPNLTVSSSNTACIAPTPVFERKKKHLQLPPPLNKHKENILEVLHNHHLLRRKIWCQCRITSCKAATHYQAQQHSPSQCPILFLSISKSHLPIMIMAFLPWRRT
ncbi:uncharacterized protein ASPGLDRAFT_50427 [Aspergillus glaucus CBS 516.65]|uniref:Uncharacterized protein n=1 Tax=Aspergillus glaucus CBS 516.65 TaxID=1160497 RepID=A0A1L9VBU2_ASPGL|nr:hypothetical protein ASPGLDRAFT_50427 [Aspergillus glaucus CBS 516.65]OJJ81363.1 hypothetical protein ASPGLDRAFT_50427 [Aspergillus glaucus CBS 516.65]